MAIQPDTELKLLKCPLLMDNKNQITFTDSEAQFNYFNNLPKLEVENFKYQRHNGVIRYPAHIDSLLEYNYCMYLNENYTDKWFYAFITNMVYINDNMTEIYISTDVFQTWQFNFAWKQSFVEREMINVADDIPGNNLIPESLELGEIKVASNISIDDLKPVFIIAFTGDHIGSTPISQDGYRYNGIPSSVAFIVCLDITINIVLNMINQDGNGDKILNVFSIPKLAVKSLIPVDPPGTTTYWWQVLGDHKENPLIKVLNSTPASIDGYTPKNQKLRTYPFTYLGFNPQNGTSKIYRFENFANGTPSFKVISEINPSPEVQFVPQNYRGSNGDSLSDNASLNGYPTISYKNDVFNSWLAKDAGIINLQMEQDRFNYDLSQKSNELGLLGNIGSMMTGNLIGGYLGMAQQGANMAKNVKDYEYKIRNQMAQIERQKLLPDNASLSSSNATLLGYELFQNNIFTVYNIKSQFARRIDKYFDMFGYATNELKIPNTNNRPNWNYIKTSNANIIGKTSNDNITDNIPQQDLLLLKSFFDNGITLWHNTATFLDYSQNNR